MPLRDDLLTPIPGDNPGGVDLRYDPLYDKIKEARREDDDAPQGDWARARKVADWPQVIKLAGDALATKTKDVQLAAWLTEAFLKREGVAGLRDGLVLLHGLLDRFWDHLYPEIDDGDAEMRAAPLEWVGLKLETAVRQAPLTRAGHGYLKLQEAKALGYEDPSADSDRIEARNAAISEGKLPLEEWDRAFNGTPKAWYKQLVADVDEAHAKLQELDTLGQEKFGDVAPGYHKLRNAIEDVSRSAKQLLQLKLEKEPDPVEVGAGTSMVTTDGSGGGASAGSGAVQAGATLAPEPVSRDDASARLAVVARYLRQQEPTSPAPYLLVRGYRWGELRASGSEPDPRLLEAPPTQIRSQLKALLLDARWGDLLEASETVMSTPFGRGWLDLQRYAVAACEGLGADYAGVAQALTGALRALLTDLPTLTEATLMDDTPTCNAETRGWLRKAVLGAGASGPEVMASDEEPVARAAATSNSNDPFPRAVAEARAGRPERGVEMISRALAGEKSRRGRFVRQTQMAEVMVEGNLHAVARPILDDLVAQVESFKLEDWESPDVVARPLVLLWKVLDRMDDGYDLKQSLYLRVCRLDPLAAMSFSAGGSGSSSSYETAAEE